MQIPLECSHCHETHEYDAFKLLGVPLTLFKSFKHSIHGQTGTVMVSCLNCGEIFEVPKRDIMNITAKDKE